MKLSEHNHIQNIPQVLDHIASLGIFHEIAPSGVSPPAACRPAQVEEGMPSKTVESQYFDISEDDNNDIDRVYRAQDVTPF